MSTFQMKEIGKNKTQRILAFPVDVKRNQFRVNNTYYGPLLGLKITW